MTSLGSDITHNEANAVSDGDKHLLAIRNLSVYYSALGVELKAIRGVSLEIYRGETYGLVGESGCGKSTLAFSIMQYLARNGRIASGEIIFLGRNLVVASQKQLRAIWAKDVSMVYQNPSAVLNPALKVGKQIAEVNHVIRGASKEDSWNEGVSMLENMNIPDAQSVAKRYPHELSGGMKQRICIGMALIGEPPLLIMDEPTTNLDVTTEKVILNLIRDLKKQFSVALLYISHNLGVVREIADRVGIMYLGKLVEEGLKEDIYSKAIHPYTRGLMNCVPKIGACKNDRRLIPIPGSIPSLTNIPSGCAFNPRCAYKNDKCTQTIPTMKEYGREHKAACWKVRETGTRNIDRERFGYSMERNKLEYPSSAKKEPILEVSQLKTYFVHRDTVKAVDSVSLHMNKSSTLGIVGESGCGKSTLARTIIGLLEPTDGKIYFRGKDITLSWHKRSRETVNAIQMIFQDPGTSLNPAHTIKKIIGRSIKMQKGIRGSKLDQSIIDLLRKVNLGPEFMERFPSEMSSGQKQRVAIARAFAGEPDVIICDEPTSSLDVSVQASILHLLLSLQAEKEVSYLFISHDLNVVYHLSDFIAVMYLGKICEIGSTEDFLNPPYHPYTEALLSAVPIPDRGVKQRSIELIGSIPSAINPPSGCRFHTRCPRKRSSLCESEKPPLVQVSDEHIIYCHLDVTALSKATPVITFGTNNEEEDGNAHT